MEYLILAGNGLRISLDDVLGDNARFFWDVAAPIGLALVWIACVFSLLGLWLSRGGDPEERNRLLPKLFFSFLLFFLILGSGSGLEYLLLGGGHIHSQVLGGILNFIFSFRPSA